jgi:hypothetical protein
MSNISSNLFLSDLSKALRNGFHSAFSISNAILTDGIVLLGYYYQPLLLACFIFAVAIPIPTTAADEVKWEANIINSG